MKRFLTRGALGLSVLTIGLSATPAPSLAATTTSACAAPTLSQPFLAWGDSNQYALVGGQAADSFTGAGWTLTGGAKIITATLSDGVTGSVLDLPAGSQAVSPTTCVTVQDPDARAMIANLSGSNGGKLNFSVSYAGTSTANAAQQTGTFKTTGASGVKAGWLLSQPAALQPGAASGWQLLQITLAPSGPKKSEFQLYNLYIDPRMVF